MGTDRSGGTAREQATGELADLVVNMELTLVSVIQATVIFFLIEGAHQPLVERRYATWPYVMTAFVIALLFWTRAMGHTLTVIRWPLDYLHNFLYLACTVLQSLMAAELAKPERWYLMGFAYTVLIWLLFVADARMIRRRAAESRAPESRALFDRLGREQALNIKLFVPASAALIGAAAFAVWKWPAVLVDGGWHVLLASVQLFSACGYLIYSVCFFANVAPDVVAHREAELRLDPDA